MYQLQLSRRALVLLSLGFVLLAALLFLSGFLAGLRSATPREEILPAAETASIESPSVPAATPEHAIARNELGAEPRAESAVAGDAQRADRYYRFRHGDRTRIGAGWDRHLRLSHRRSVPGTPYGDLIYEIAVENSINPKLVAAIVKVESGFDRYAVSPKGALGLMQLMPETAARFGVPDERLFDPQSNIEAGVSYLRWLSDRFAGDLELVLSAYNAGEGVVDRYDGIPPYPETREYVRRVAQVITE